MRKGLHPLSVHLGLAAAKSKEIQDYALSFQLSYSKEQITEMVRGIKLYQGNDYEPHRLKTNIIWQSGTVKILEPFECIRSGSVSSKPLLLVPSLINKSYILDLSEKRSLLRWLRSNGVNAYLLDWGDLAHDEASKNITMNDLVELKLCGAIKYLADMYSYQVDVLGYCMGGTLLVAAHKFANEYIDRMIFLASPWDFNSHSSSSGDNLVRAVRIWAPLVLPAIEDKNILPSSYVQALFASLGSDDAIQKFIRFASLDQNSEEAQFFVSVEDWLNDEVDIPGSIAKSCIEDWFIKNLTFNNKWAVGGECICAADIKTDVLIVASKKDCLVPYDSALALKKQISSSKSSIIEPSTGHIGLIVGNNAVGQVWTPMLSWLKS